MRMFNVLRFLDIKYPAVLQQAFAQGENTELAITTDLPSSWIEDAKYYSPPQNFKKYGVSGLFIINYWHYLTMIMTTGGITLLFYVLLKLKDKIENTKIKYIIDLGCEVFLWNYIISYFLSCSGIAIFYTLIELQSLRDHGPTMVMLASIFVDFANLFSLVMVLNHLMNKSKEIRNDPILRENPEIDKHPKLKRYKVLFLDYKMNRLLELYFSYILIVRSVAYYFIVTMIPGSPTV
jgi:hypothetical protein